MCVHMNQTHAGVRPVDVGIPSKGVATLGNGTALLREASGVSKTTLDRAWSTLG